MIISFDNFRIHSILILILIVIVVILDPAYSDTDTHIPIIRRVAQNTKHKTKQTKNKTF